MLLNKGGIVFDSYSSTNTVKMDGATFQVDGYKPIAYSCIVAPASDVSAESDDQDAGVEKLATIFVRGSQATQELKAREDGSARHNHSTGAVSILLESGEMVIHPVFDTTIKSPYAQVNVRKGALMSVSLDPSGLRVINCGSMGSVTVSVGDQVITLASGEEIVVADHALSNEDMYRADGIGRRDFRDQMLPGGLHAARCDVSIFSLLANTDHLQALRHPGSALEKALAGKLLKTAAALQTITQTHGAYQARPRLTAPSRFAQPGFIPVSYKQ